MKLIKEHYALAKKIYSEIGVDTDAALARLKNVKISLQCWQGDDVEGFLFKDNALSGGIQVTGNYPDKARNAKELRTDLEFALSLIPGNHKVNLHAIYADTEEKVDLDQLEPHHFATWVEWAKAKKIGLDFNPTCFSHEKAETGFTLSSTNPEIREFWIRHCRASRKIGAYFGKELGQKSVVNIWIPDGYKDIPVDRFGPRMRLKEALDQIFADKYKDEYIVDAIEPKLFGIGAEAYTVGSSEFYFGYAVQNGKALCLDTGHFHPTEMVSDKISAVLLYTKELLLHISRPMRWDSDHVVILDEELCTLASELVRNDLLERTHIGLDFFDASINRIAAWVIGARSVQKALLRAFLEPTELLKKYEAQGDYTSRLALLEELKSYPYAAVYDYFCATEGVAPKADWLDEVKKYEMSLER